MRIAGVIPARLESTRLPRKMLRMIQGKPLIQWTYENAAKIKLLDEVLVACDDAEIERAVLAFGGKVILTAKNHNSGTSRLTEVAARVNADLFINIQGDEPLVDHAGVEALAKAMLAAPEVLVGTIAVRSMNEADFRDPNVVKAVADQAGNALYFSRSPIPYDREGKFAGFLKHLGVYAYRRRFLAEIWKSLRPSALEEQEKLEQLRFLDNGIAVKLVIAERDSKGVDTEEDLRAVEAVLRR